MYETMANFWTEAVQVKVPQVTVYFWIIKVLCTTVGETFADLLNLNAGLGYDKTIAITFSILVVLLVIQFGLSFYVPFVYWASVVFISTAGTLITDSFADQYNIPLWGSSLMFAIALAIAFALWYYFERTLAIHSIYTRKREAFYWSVVLFTFGLGTAVGDWISEGANLGYGNTVLLFAGAIVLVTLIWFFRKQTKANSVLCFWVAYILTRPLGASIGDFLSQNPADQVENPDDPVPSHWKAGCNLGTAITTGVFLGLILLIIAFLSFTKEDQIQRSTAVTAVDNISLVHSGSMDVTAGNDVKKASTDLV